MAQSVLAAGVDRGQLRRQIKAKYTEVALEPEKGFHFHTGRPLAAMLGYDDADVDWLPPSTVESFAGTGNPFSLGRLGEGEVVLDIGCGAGFDTLLAARQVGPHGSVIAVDMTEGMLDKTRAGAAALRLSNVEARHGFAEDLPAASVSIDVVISNGVINLATDKSKVFSEVARLLKSGGRFAISDIVTEVQLPENIVCNSTLWAACIGGAAQQDNYRGQIAAAGMKVVKVQDNPTYQFISDNARGASKKFGVKSISLLAVKPS